MKSLERLKIMVVDDNAHMIHIVETLLRSFGCKEVLSARDAGEAFDRLKHDSVDIIIVDYQMEILDGIDFIRLVRNSTDSNCKYVPIVMLTAHSERQRVEAARDAGVTEFCCKPVTAKEIFRKISAVVDSPRPFIKVSTYFGPDRRRKADPRYDGPERRLANQLDI